MKFNAIWLSLLLLPLISYASENKECVKCHSGFVKKLSHSAHKEIGCPACHDNAAEHLKNRKILPKVNFSAELCGNCHQNQYKTYFYDDQNKNKLGRYGGSPKDPKEPRWAKTAQFPLYNKLIAGHGFTKEYNEDRAHKFMLEDHYKVTRGKYDVCIQCKSTKVAYYWGREQRIEKDTEVTLYHLDGQPNILIPAGTIVRTGTNWKTSSVITEVLFPDGRTFTSKDPKAEPIIWATAWAGVFALAKEELPYGASCSHCHDPHTTDLRLVRKAVIKAAKENAMAFKDASLQNKKTLLCGQCHIEYLCGKGVDGINRDDVPFRHVSELESYYAKKFKNMQDFKHKLIGETLVKSQHPDMETFWGSKFYRAGASCSSCHMPRLKWGDSVFTSHWFTSPLKYLNLFSQGKTGSGEFGAFPCLDCHKAPPGMSVENHAKFLADQVIIVQEKIFKSQERVQKALSVATDVIEKAKKAKDAGKIIDESLFAEAINNYRRAHLLWENLIVSENSMGFHNPEEVFDNMAEALEAANFAKEKALQSAP